MYPFSFMTVSGGLATMGPNVGEVVGLSSYNAMMPPPPVGIGNLPINVLYVFVPPGSPNGGGTPGATIDEFDQTTGQLIDDNFVTVTPDPGGYQTEANVDGFVPTTMSAENIVALPTTSPTGVDFFGWLTLGPPAEMSSSATLGGTGGVGMGQSVMALAFYNAPPANLGTISGTVSEDTEGGIFLLGGATVSAVPGGVTKSNPDGTYVLTNLTPGPVAITVAHPVTTEARGTITVIAGQTITEDFVLTRIPTRS